MGLFPSNEIKYPLVFYINTLDPLRLARTNLPKHGGHRLDGSDGPFLDNIELMGKGSAPCDGG